MKLSGSKIICGKFKQLSTIHFHILDEDPDHSVSLSSKVLLEILQSLEFSLERKRNNVYLVHPKIVTSPQKINIEAHDSFKKVLKEWLHYRYNLRRDDDLVNINDDEDYTSFKKFIEKRYVRQPDETYTPKRVNRFDDGRGE